MAVAEDTFLIAFCPWILAKLIRCLTEVVWTAAGLGRAENCALVSTSPSLFTVTAPYRVTCKYKAQHEGKARFAQLVCLLKGGLCQMEDMYSKRAKLWASGSHVKISESVRVALLRHMNSFAAAIGSVMRQHASQGCSCFWHGSIIKCLIHYTFMQMIQNTGGGSHAAIPAGHRLRSQKGLRAC